MGDLIVMSEHRLARSRGCAGPTQDPDGLATVSSFVRRRGAATVVSFYFDVSCPFSYLASERVDRTFGSARWIPASSLAMRDEAVPAVYDEPDLAAIGRAELRAAELRLPLIWPDRFPVPAPRALRAAAYAAEVGAGARFALAAGRLAFCGGFDLDTPDVIAEAAAAAGIKLDACMQAAADDSRDHRLYATGRWLHNLGVRQLPAMRVTGRWFGGERALAGAMAASRAV